MLCFSFAGKVQDRAYFASWEQWQLSDTNGATQPSPVPRRVRAQCSGRVPALCAHQCAREGSFVCAAARWPEVRFFGERVNPFNPKVETLDDETMYFDTIWGGRLTTQLELSAFDAVRDGLLLVLCDGRYASARIAQG